MTDLVKEIPVAYTGILPDLFKEGKGAVVQVKPGTGGEYVATEVLAKHDENYMPPEAKDALDKAQKTKGASTP
jgi:cytochrome c-type biogenesis protein CcmE